MVLENIKLNNTLLFAYTFKNLRFAHQGSLKLRL